MTEILTYAVILLLFIPIILATYWWITLPIYYCIVGMQFRAVMRLRALGIDRKDLVRLAWIQAALPILNFVLYPFMPGNTATGEPLGLNEKAYLSFVVTLIAAIVCLYVFILKTGVYRRKRKAE